MSCLSASPLPTAATNPSYREVVSRTPLPLAPVAAQPHPGFVAAVPAVSRPQTYQPTGRHPRQDLRTPHASKTKDAATMSTNGMTSVLVPVTVHGPIRLLCDARRLHLANQPFITIPEKCAADLRHRIAARRLLFALSLMRLTNWRETRPCSFFGENCTSFEN